MQGWKKRNVKRLSMGIETLQYNYMNSTAQKFI